MSRGKATPILPHGEKEERSLFTIMVIMSFLASLILIVALMGLRQSKSWENDLQAAGTVQVLAENETDLERILSLLDQTPGINKSELISETDNRDLLKPWIGDVALPDDITVPRLIKIEADYDKLDQAALNGSFTENGLKAEFDNHRQWSRNLITTWARFRLALLGLLALILTATIAISSFATHSVLGARKNIIKVLGQVGATDKFISNLFVKRFLSLGFKASACGMVLAIFFIAIFMLWQNLGTDETGLKLNLNTIDVAWLFALALAMGLISAVSAGRSARKSIQSQIQK